MWVSEYHNDGTEIITSYDPQHQDGVIEWYRELVATGQIRAFQTGDR
jgi:hypothetical protein